MTGPEHYAMAEGLTALFRSDKGAALSVDRAAFTVAMAQVHATLALAAATSDLIWATLPADDLGHESPVVSAWAGVTK